MLEMKVAAGQVPSEALEDAFKEVEAEQGKDSLDSFGKKLKLHRTS